MSKGSCLCGTVRYETSVPLEHIDHCHCSMCRRSHGAAFSTYGRVPKEAYRVTSGESNLKAYASSDAVVRSFCDRCGSSLLFQHAALPEYNFVAVGTLDEDPGTKPEAHIFVESKASWYDITDDLPQHAQYPPNATD